MLDHIEHFRQIEDGSLRRLPRAKLPSFKTLALPGLAVTSGALVCLAGPDLIQASNAFDYVKVGLMGLGAGIVSYGINSLAVEKGAPLAAIGSIGAALASTISILSVGAALFGATYAGLVREDTDRLQLEEAVGHQGRYIQNQAALTLPVAGIGPVIATIEAGFSEAAECERATSCISRRGNGGEGRVYFALRSDAQKAAAVAEQVAMSDIARNGASETTGALLQNLQEVVSDRSLSGAERRARAQDLVSEIGQGVNEGRSSASATLAASFATSLETPIEIAERPAATRTINQMRARYAEELRSALAGVKSEDLLLPGLPGEAGVSDTFRWLGHFLPIAMIVAVVELIFPITVWLYTVFGLRAQLVQTAANSASKSSPKSSRTYRKSKGDTHAS